MEEKSLTQIYHQRSQETLHIWRNPTTAKAYSGFYPENLKAIATGIQPALTQPISTLLAELREVVLDDPLADIMQPDHFHLTFLAVTPSCYDQRHQPEGVEGLTRIAAAHCLEKELVVRELRLVALPNQLLIAGIANAADIARREAFWQALQHSDYAGLLKERYSGSARPPTFWHSTLLRYNAAVLPERLQQFFKARMNQRYGEITGTIQLRLVTYNWSQTAALS
ncbi:hypothetical protein [Erwinia sp. 198]|uniref:hypothetical protein n=1 Tax=Erwinia sp. 198 TaxID=2022746 RepID=UPI000F664412|nr:hypothetical protein [Erwinia sp. 198]RRZ93513.1 hypothetical protein EGK14_06860 [Erwinia sp. 198]